MYFQFPLMVLIIAPAIDGLRREWLEASENLGASSFQYWRYVALPILLPSIMGTMILLFGNSFGAFATAQALTGGQINLVTIVIGSQLRGDVLGDPGIGICHGARHGGCHGFGDYGLYPPPKADREVVAMRRGNKVWSWFIDDSWHPLFLPASGGNLCLLFERQNSGF